MIPEEDLKRYGMDTFLIFVLMDIVIIGVLFIFGWSFLPLFSMGLFPLYIGIVGSIVVYKRSWMVEHFEAMRDDYKGLTYKFAAFVTSIIMFAFPLGAFSVGYLRGGILTGIAASLATFVYPFFFVVVC